MVKKGLNIPKAPELEPHHQIQFRVAEVLPIDKGYKWHILSPIDKASFLWNHLKVNKNDVCIYPTLLP